MQNSYRLHSQRPDSLSSISGELIEDRFYPIPASHVEPLSPEVLQHWGLIASPFTPKQPLDQPLQATGFYFRSPAHASAWNWLQNLVSGPSSLAVLTTSSSAGATTWLRQLMATSGLGNTAVETAAISWSTQSLEQITVELQNRVGAIGEPSCVRSLWLIQAAGSPSSHRSSEPNQLTMLSQWWAVRAKQLRNLNVVWVTRRSAAWMVNQPHLGSSSQPNASPLGRHHLARAHCHELRRCVNAALHHAGAIRPAFTVSAVTHLAEASGGSIARLGTLVHTALVRGQIDGLRQIRRSDLIWCQGIDDRMPAGLKQRAA